MIKERDLVRSYVFRSRSRRRVTREEKEEKEEKKKTLLKLLSTQL